MFTMMLAGPLELLFVLFGFGLGLPAGVPPAPEDPVMAKMAPEECLFYAAWSGTVDPDPHSPNQTEQLLAEPEIRHFVEQVAEQIRTAIRNQTGSTDSPIGALAEEGIRWGQHLLSSPGAMFLSKASMGPAGPQIEAGLVVRAGDNAKQLEDWLVQVQKDFLPQDEVVAEVDDHGWHRLRFKEESVPPIVWGVRGPYLLLGVGDGAVEGIMARARTEPPQWLAELREQLPVERVAGVSYLNVKGALQAAAPLMAMAGGGRVPAVLESLGMSNVRAIASVNGLDGQGVVNRTLVMLDGEPGGLLAFADAAPLTADDLAGIPRDATFAFATRLNAAEVLKTVLSAVEKIEPNARAEAEEGIGEMQEELGIDLRADLLAALGDRWCVYNAPSEGGLVFTGITGVVSIKDHALAAATHAKLLAKARQEMARDERGPRIEEFTFAGQTVYLLNARDDDVPVAPAWCLTENELIVALFPQNVKAYLARGEQYESIAAVPEVASLLGDGTGPVALSYVDTRQLFDLFYPILPFVAQVALGELSQQGIDLNVSIVPSAAAIRPHLRPSVGAVRRHGAGIEFVGHQTVPGGGSLLTVAPMVVGITLPAISSARDAARRAQSMSHLKQISLALFMYESDHGSFPPAYTTDDEGTPLLSWRVLLLPYLGPQDLYERFHLDEPWDSEHNKPLLPLMPEILAAPNGNAGPGKTHYLTVRGEKTIFSGKEKIKMADIVDGMSNTIMLVEVDDARAVPWTAPADFAYDKEQPGKGLGGLRREGFLAGFADGAVRVIPSTIDPETLRRLFQRNDGEPVDWSEF